MCGRDATETVRTSEKNAGWTFTTQDASLAPIQHKTSWSTTQKLDRQGQGCCVQPCQRGFQSMSLANMLAKVLEGTVTVSDCTYQQGLASYCKHA